MFPREIPSAVSDLEAVQLQELSLGKVVLEMGAHYGFSTIVLAQAAQLVHSVDWHMGDSMAGAGDNLLVFRENLRRHGADQSVVAHVGRFEDILPVFRTGFFDGCFIDGEHDRVSVDRDSQLAFRVIKKGGWLAWHDYGRFDVKEVVDEFCGYLRTLPLVVDHVAWIVKE